MPHNIKISSDLYTTSDGFGYDKYAETIIQLITDKDFPTPFTFGVFGEWGSGKTSLMRMIEETLLNDYFKSFIPVWFNPWRYEKEEHLIVPFAKTIQHAIGRHLAANETKGAAQKLTEQAVVKLRSLGGWFSKMAFALAAGFEAELNLEILKFKYNFAKAIERGEKIEGSEKAKEIADLEEISSLYYDTIRYLREASDQEPGNLRLVIFIDDLDRCLPEKAIEVLEGIKTFLDMQGYIFLIGVDAKVIEKGVRVKYKGFVIDDQKDQTAESKEIPITPSDYLEKIIQLPIFIPPVDKTRVDDYLKSLMQENEALQPFIELIHLGLKKNPRTYKRFVNTLAFHTKLATCKECLQTISSPTESGKPKMTLELLVKWTILNFAYPKIVEETVKEKFFLVDLQNWINKVERDEKNQRESTEWTTDEASDMLNDVPNKFKLWMSDEHLKVVLRINDVRKDKGFSRETLDLYVQMGEFTLSSLTAGESRIVMSPISVNAAGFRHPDTGFFVKITAGEFIYQKDKSEKLPYYEIGMFPVTNEDYKKFIEANPEHPVPGHWDAEGRQYPADKEDHPVVNVNFHDAQAYCKWKTEMKDGYVYRLPTEKEWEKAAAGKDGRAYPWGDEFDKENCNTLESEIKDTTLVNNYPNGISPYGCYDMAGNVWEWCADWYDKEEKYKSLRGGSWDFDHGDARCTSRVMLLPDARGVNVGFRCVRTRNEKNNRFKDTHEEGNSIANGILLNKGKLPGEADSEYWDRIQGFWRGG